mgnify:CR=1 FL=1
MRAITPILTLSALALGAGAGLSVAAAKISGPQRPVLDYALTPYDPALEEEISAGRAFVREYRDTFHQLAK